MTLADAAIVWLGLCGLWILACLIVGIYRGWQTFITKVAHTIP